MRQLSDSDLIPSNKCLILYQMVSLYIKFATKSPISRTIIKS